MLKKDITYTTFDDETVTETYYFHLAKNEIVGLEARFEGGLQGLIRRIGLTKDMQTVLQEMERIVLLTVGEKSADGRHFIKTDAIRDAFKASPAYDELFMELLTTENAAADFITAALPKELQTAVKEQQTLPVPNIKPVEKLERQEDPAIMTTDLVPPPPTKTAPGQTPGTPGVHL